MNEIEKSLNFWNDLYKGFKSDNLKFTGDEIENYTLKGKMKNLLEDFLLESNKVLDFGFGDGRMLFSMNLIASKDYYAIEKGEDIVNYMKKKVEDNNLNIKVFNGGIKQLEKFEDEFFDRIVVSNVLDVIEKKESDDILKEFKRVLSKTGLIFLKLNPSLTHDELLKMGFLCFKDNMYSKNGIFRARNLSTTMWENELEKDFIVLKKDTVEWQAPLFYDRVFILKKR